MSSPPSVGVLSNRYLEGWGGGAVTAPLLPVTQIETALSTEYPTDAHITGYGVPDESAWPRLNVEATRHLPHEPQMRVVFADLDRTGHSKWPSSEDAKAAVDTLGALFPDAAVYATGGGARLVWWLANPVPVGRYKAFYAGVIRRVSAALAGSGLPLEVDPSADQWTRLFRLPWVLRDGVPTRATSHLRIPSPWRPFGRPDVEENLLVEAPLSEVPPEGMTSARRAEVFEAIHPLISEHVDARFPGLLEDLAAGRVFFAQGTRNATVFNAVCLVAEALTDALGEAPSAEALYELFEGSVSATTGKTSPERALRELWDVCQRRVRVEERRALEAEAVAAKLEEYRLGLDLPPVAYANNTYYVLDSRDPTCVTYRPPVTNAKAVPAMIEKYCEGKHVNIRGKKGNYIGLSEILGTYGEQIADVVHEMGRKGAYLDRATSILRIGTSPPADVSAVYHPDVACWLERFAGDAEGDHDALLDWLATVRRLDRPTCALYLQGAKGAGKGMFAAGVASLWGAGAVSFAEATSRFNAALLESPIVFLDEKHGGSGTSAAFRSLVSETERRVEAKGQPTQTVNGCFRVIVAANNAFALPLSDAVSADDIDAIVDRVRWINVGRDTSAYLEAIGGREGTHDWVRQADGRPGRIAEHILWLESNREVTSSKGSRFIVSGVRREWHDSLIVTEIRADVAGAVARALSRGESAPAVVTETSTAGVVTALVSAEALRDAWAELTNDNYVPTSRDIAEALHAMCVERGVRRRDKGGVQRRYFRLPGSAIISGAELLQVGDLDRLHQTFGVHVGGKSE